MFDALGDWLDAQPPDRRRLSTALLGIILLTLPCYGVGGAVYLMSAPPAPGGPAADASTPTSAATAAQVAPPLTEAPRPTDADDDSPPVPTVVRRATITSGPVLPAAPTDTPVATPFAPSATPPPTDAPTAAPTVPSADTATSPPPTDAPPTDVPTAAPTEAPTDVPTSPPEPTAFPIDPTAEPTSGAPAPLDRGAAHPR